MTGSTLAIVPARGGSKRVPGKNLKRIAGRSLVEHAVEQAAATTSITDVVLSTDDDDIAAVGRGLDECTVLDRPTRLATDTADVTAVVDHVIEAWSDPLDTIALLQPTSPLREPVDIDGAVRALGERNVPRVVSVTPYTQPPQFALVEENGTLDEYAKPGLLFESTVPREQDIDELLYPNGAVYVARVSAWRETQTFYADPVAGYRMPPERSLQIDEPWELDLVRAYMEQDS